MNKIEALQDAVRDGALPLAARKRAAEMYVAALLAEVPETGEDDDAVVALMTPPEPRGDELMDHLYLTAWKHMNYLRGWREDGGTLAQAHRFVHEKRRAALLGAC